MIPNNLKSFNIDDVQIIEEPKVTVTSVFRQLMLSASILHLGFLLLFWFVTPVKILVYFNIGSIILYLIIYFFIVEKNFLLAVILSFIEILIHSSLANYYLGWNYGFANYTLCMLPIVYFSSIHYTKNWNFGNVCAVVIFTTFFLMKFSSYVHIGQYENLFKSLEFYFYIFNATASGVILNVLIVTYIYEMKFSKNILEKNNEILKNIANIDPLTKILNRRAMSYEMKQAIAEFEANEHKFSIILGDIDNFKSVNDNYGHDVGDAVLIVVSDVLKKYSESENIFVSRWGGEEFLILVKNTTLEESKEIGEKILEDIRGCKVPYEDTYLSITMTFGCSLCDKKLKHIEDVIKEADNNLYIGKISTKNCLVI